jgi:hypothetical protein
LGILSRSWNTFCRPLAAVLGTKVVLASNRVVLVAVFAVAGNVDELIGAGAVVMGYVVFVFSWIPFHSPGFTSG